VKTLAKAIADLDETTALQLVRRTLDTGKDPISVLNEMREGLEIVGKRFEKGEYFLSELVMASEIFLNGMRDIEPRLRRGKAPTLGRVVVGTVKGDMHDIGKNVLAVMLQCTGFEVYDLGVDVPPAKFVETVREKNPQVVGLSGLLTLALDSMKEIVDALESAGLRGEVKVVIGGYPVNSKWAELVGADAWSNDAVRGVDTIKRLAGRR
jgi:methylmalonyl-CoA mutase cobalamin-binding domain/chain